MIIHKDKDYLRTLVFEIRTYFKDNLFLTLHPDKIYLQHYSKGVKYLGAVIKPNRIYIANRIKGNFYNSIIRYNDLSESHKPDKTELQEIQCSINSYLGIMIHYKSYNIRKLYLATYLSSFLKKKFTTTIKYNKIVVKRM